MQLYRTVSNADSPSVVEAMEEEERKEKKGGKEGEEREKGVIYIFLLHW